MDILSQPIIPSGTTAKSLLPVLGITVLVAWVLGLGKWRKNPSRRRRGNRSRRR